MQYTSGILQEDFISNSSKLGIYTPNIAFVYQDKLYIKDYKDDCWIHFTSDLHPSGYSDAISGTVMIDVYLNKTVGFSAYL